MELNKEKNPTIMLFAGIHLNSGLRLFLSQSKSWKQLQVLPSEERGGLREVHYQGKDYIGMFLRSDKITLGELKNLEKTIKMALKAYCAEKEVEPLKIWVFPQLFIA